MNGRNKIRSANRKELSTAGAGPTTFWFCYWLCVISAICKGVTLQLFCEPTPGPFGRWHDFLIAWRPDVKFIATVGLVFQGLLILTRRWRVVRGVIWVGFLALATSSAFYAIASVWIFSYLRTPLTYPLLSMAGDMKNMRSSVGAFVTPSTVTLLVGGPLMYLLLSFLSQRFFPRADRGSGALVPLWSDLL